MPAIEGSQATQDAQRAWQAVHSDPTIQFTPVSVPPVNTERSGWLKALDQFLKDLIEPIARAIGMSEPVLKWVVIAIVGLVALYALWRIAEPWLERRRPSRAAETQSWAPDQHEALALLEDADRLASEGRFDEATHLLLRRSVSQIAMARPDWVHPASTAREIAAIGALPDAARGAFAAISQRVERSCYALRTLDAADWQAARAAYADFALQRLPVAA